MMNFCLLIFLLTVLYQIIKMINPSLLCGFYNVVCVKQKNVKRTNSNRTTRNRVTVDKTQKVAISRKEKVTQKTTMVVILKDLAKPCRVDGDERFRNTSENTKRKAA